MAQLEVNYKLSIVYYLQTNKQIERTNRTIEQYLRTFVNKQQDNWVELLPNAQFAINSVCLDTIEETLFLANYKYQLVLYNQPRKDTKMAKVVIQEVNNLKTLYKEICKDIEFK